MDFHLLNAVDQSAENSMLQIAISSLKQAYIHNFSHFLLLNGQFY